MSIKSIKTKMAAIAAVATLSFGTAQAVPFVWTDIYDPKDIYLNAPDSTSFAHDITDGAHGFRPGIDTITSASLTLWLYDDALLGDLSLFGHYLGDEQEYVTFNFDNQGWTTKEAVDGNFLLKDLFHFSLDSLLNTGVLDVVVKAFKGDFYFDKSLLVVTGDRSSSSPSTSVPEPGTLALLGLGLLGMGLARRVRRKP